MDSLLARDEPAVVNTANESVRSAITCKDGSGAPTRVKNLGGYGSRNGEPRCIVNPLIPAE